MKPRALLIVLSLGVLIATVAKVRRQRQQLSDLRCQAQELRSRNEALTNATPAEADASQPVVIATQSGPPLELLRMRSQVGQLERRKRELLTVAGENKQLQAQLVAKATTGASVIPLPAGYIRKSEAKYAGFGSPEDSVQSFLWAIEHRDLPTVVQFFSPEQSKQIAADLGKRGSGDFFKDAGTVPGLLITGREQKDDGVVELTVQIAPNDDSTQKMRFKQFDGQWRLIAGF